MIRTVFSKKDIVLICILILVGIGITVYIFFPGKQESSRQVQVSVDGKITATYSLNQDREDVISTKHKGRNKFVIKNHTVTMVEANCHDSTCMKRGKISRVGESIVCLPHGVVIKIVSNKIDNDDVDAVVK